MKTTLIIFTAFILFSCDKTERKIIEKKPNYNEKALELINQVLIQNDPYSECLLINSDKSLLKFREEFGLISKDDRKLITEKLRITSNRVLDSLDKQSGNFVLDKGISKIHNLNLISRPKSISESFKICPKGIVNISTPIFSLDFQSAVIYYDEDGYDCFSGRIYKYKFENGKWIEE